MSKRQHPEWFYSTNIYEVNVRQYTSEGTFKAFEKHLPRLKDMGVEILWFMPITPISVKGRKGTLGSYYAVEDYTAINPEFGLLNDFTELVKTAHSYGFKIIIDWVANHTGNDNVWMEQYPDFFSYGEDGKIIHPHGWEDVSKLNYDNEEMRKAMIAAMGFWITESDIDGFRCDMAHLVPLDFWKEAKSEVEKIKPDLFWLAECEESKYHEVFNATYTWNWMHKTEEFCKGNASINDLVNLLSDYDLSFPKDALRIYFTTNHDENSWNGTEYEKYGEAAKAFAVFSCMWNGIPMIYSGQEVPNEKRLKFFDKDEIQWDKSELHTFYKTLLTLHSQNKALRAGDANIATFLRAGVNDKTLSFRRVNDDAEIAVILNFSDDVVNYEIDTQGIFRNIFTNENISLQQNSTINLEPWSYLVFERTA